MTITETTQGETITMRLELDIMGQYHAAVHDGRARYAIIDGLLWWAMKHQVNAFTAWALAKHPNEPACHTAESLNHYLWHLDYANTDNGQAVRIMRTLSVAVAKLEPLATTPETAALWRQMVETASMLQQRMDAPGAAWLAVEKLIHSEI